MTHLVKVILFVCTKSSSCIPQSQTPLALFLTFHSVEYMPAIAWSGATGAISFPGALQIVNDAQMEWRALTKT
jgi:hypothetical protein